MQYTVKQGDTLSIIARDVLNDISRWPEIAKLNNLSPQPTLVATNNPIYLIFPGQVLTLPDASGTTSTTSSNDSKVSSMSWMLPVGIGLLLLGVAAGAVQYHRKKKKKSAQLGKVEDSRVESVKKINALKMHAVRNGGFAKFKDKILAACEAHKIAFGVDLTPKHLKG